LIGELTKVLLLCLMAGLAIPLGGFLARIERLGRDWLEQEFRHAVMAFGGGALLSAVALVLTPEGVKHLAVGWVALCFIAGGVAMMLLDRLLAWWGRPASNLVAALSDFLPEAIALGAAFGGGQTRGGMLLALLIALQNLPEGFNAYREMHASGEMTAGRILVVFVGMALLGPLAGGLGYGLLGDSPKIVAAVMLVAAGGILYIVIQDIAPQVKLQRHWAPPLGAVLGFLLGVVGQMLIGA